MVIALLPPHIWVEFPPHLLVQAVDLVALVASNVLPQKHW
jgi:hypothetical protein